jgi:hypothetical protein
MYIHLWEIEQLGIVVVFAIRAVKDINLENYFNAWVLPLSWFQSLFTWEVTAHRIIYLYRRD